MTLLAHRLKTYMSLSSAQSNRVQPSLTYHICDTLDEESCDSRLDEEKRDFHMPVVRRQMPRSPPSFVWASGCLKLGRTTCECPFPGTECKRATGIPSLFWTGTSAPRSTRN